MIFGSVCSGIEAASCAWEALGWEAAWFSEIDKFPSAVLAHRFPSVPNLGDMAMIQNSKEFDARAIDLLVGGTPCQAFSVAGLRKGLADPRGNLTLVYLGIVERARPRWIVWENVPGVLSIDGGRTFGAFLGGLEKLGYGFAYRILNAQFFGVPQRRRRVFVVGYLGDWSYPAAVLFERESLQRNLAAGGKSRSQVAGTLTARTRGGGGLGTDFETDGGLVAHTLRGEGFDASEDGTGRGTPLVPMPFDTTQITHRANRSNPQPGDPSPTLANSSKAPAIAFSCKDHGADAGAVSPTLRAMGSGASTPNGGGQVAIAFHNPQDPDSSSDVTHALGAKDNGLGLYLGATVRRLTPRECERLQGFPDDWSLITYRGKVAKDGPRYKAIGNSMAVPVMRWIGERIARVDEILKSTAVIP